MVTIEELHKKMKIDDFVRMQCLAAEFVNKSFPNRSSSSISFSAFIDIFQYVIRVSDLARKIQTELRDSVPSIKTDQFFEYLDEKIGNSSDFSMLNEKEIEEFVNRVDNFVFEYRK